MGTNYNFTACWEEKMVWKHSLYWHGTHTWQCVWIRYLCAHMHTCVHPVSTWLSVCWRVTDLPPHLELRLWLSCCSCHSIILPGPRTHSSPRVNTSKPGREEPQWSQILQGIKRTILHSNAKLIIGRRIFFFCENGTARLIFGQEHCSVPCKGLVDFNWRLPLFSWSCSLLEFSFVALPDMPEHLSS